VERDLDERTEAGAELGHKAVREGSIERQERPVDADRDGTGQNVFVGGLS
jgi:hypothetical protein